MEVGEVIPWREKFDHFYNLKPFSVQLDLLTYVRRGVLVENCTGMRASNHDVAHFVDHGVPPFPSSRTRRFR